MGENVLCIQGVSKRALNFESLYKYSEDMYGVTVIMQKNIPSFTWDSYGLV
jgi:hypothetical protein